MDTIVPRKAPELTTEIESGVVLNKGTTSGKPARCGRKCYYSFFIIAIGAAIADFGCLYMLLNTSPFNQMVYASLLFGIIFWLTLFSFAFTMYFRQIREHEEEGKVNAVKYLFTRWEIIVLLIFAIALVACGFTTLTFMHPDSFYTTKNSLTYVRLGGVTENSAKIMVRNPAFQSGEEVQVQFRVPGSTTWSTSAKVAVTATNDYTAVVPLSSLASATAYEWQVLAASTGQPLQKVSTSSTPLKFKTNPAPGTPTKMRFYFGSCFVYNFPSYEHVKGFKWAKDHNPDLFFFLGDFVYADLPWIKGQSREAFSSLYRQSFTNKYVLPLLQEIPNYFMWDDHEIINDWDKGMLEPYDAAIAGAWNDYLGAGNPNTYLGKGYHSVDYGDISFFVLDTRTYRNGNKVKDSPEKTMLGKEQVTHFKAWLLARKDTAKFKFVMTTIGWLTSKATKGKDLGIGEDNFGGFLFERDDIIAFIRANAIPGVVFLTGDSHFAYSVELDFKGSGLFEFSASPISAFSNSLGGFFSAYPWASQNLSSLPDDVRWYNNGKSEGFISLMGIVDIDTTPGNALGGTPFMNLTFYEDGTDYLYHELISVNQTIPVPKP